MGEGAAKSAHQFIDHRAIMQGAVTALRLQPNQCPFHSFQVVDAFSHVIHVFLEKLVYFCTCWLQLMSEIGQSAYFALAEAQLFVAEDELQPFLVQDFVITISVCLPVRRWQQADLFVITDCLNRTIANLSEFTDTHIRLTL